MSQTANPSPGTVSTLSLPHGTDEAGNPIESVTVTATRIKDGPQWPLWFLIAAILAALLRS